MAASEHLGLQPHVVFHLGPVGFTDAHLAFMLISLLIILFGVYVANTSRVVPTRLQSVMEGIIVWFKDRVDLSFNDPKLARRILPLILTLFLAILVSNEFMTLPFLTLAEGGHPLMRVPSTHLAFPLALGLLVVISSHIIAANISPRRHFGHFIKLESFFRIRSVAGLLDWFLQAFLGFLEIIDELAKIISISARLFGNIFAGEIMALVVIGISTYTSFIVPIPLYVLGIFVGLIQAAVFSLMSIQYLSRLANSVSDPHHH